MARILIVDDRREVREAFLEALSGAGYVVAIVIDADAADKMMSCMRFDFLVIDFHLHGENGLAFLKRIRSKENLTPAILFSGDIPSEALRELKNVKNAQAIDKSQGISAVLNAIQTFFR